MTFRFQLGLWLVCSLVLGLTRAADAQDPSADERARTHFDAGRLHYDEGAYDLALTEFQRAYDLSHRLVLLLNLATVKERLGQHAEAARDLRAYLEAEPESERRERLERRIENLERLASQHGDASPPPDEPAPSTSTPRGPDDGLMAGAIASYAVGGAGLVVMAVFGGLALGEDAALRDGCGATGTCTDAQVADANTFAAVSDVGLAIGATGVAVGTVLLVVALTSNGASGDEHAAVVPWVSPNGAGLAAWGSF